MAKVKYTKSELKAQRDALRRFERYLPTLELKKQQLELELRAVENRIQLRRDELREQRRRMESWTILFSEPFDFSSYLSVETVFGRTQSIAGVSVSTLESIEFSRKVPDLHATPLWVDDALRELEASISLTIELRFLVGEERSLREELRITTQRVNLFENVKIPECRENIRRIRIFLGDQQTAAVARAKAAKKKLLLASEPV